MATVNFEFPGQTMEDFLCVGIKNQKVTVYNVLDELPELDAQISKIDFLEANIKNWYLARVTITGGNFVLPISIGDASIIKMDDDILFVESGVVFRYNASSNTIDIEADDKTTILVMIDELCLKFKCENLVYQLDCFDEEFWGSSVDFSNVSSIGCRIINLNDC
jgi:predicted RNA-binding protein